MFYKINYFEIHIFKKFQITSDDGKMTKHKVADLNEIHNFLVKSFW